MRIVYSLLSFSIFVIDFLLQLCFVAIVAVNNIVKAFLFSVIRYHNRVQLWSSKKNLIVVEEVKT